MSNIGNTMVPEKRKKLEEIKRRRLLLQQQLHQKEIIKIFNNDNSNNNINNNDETNNFLMEIDPIPIDLEKIKSVYSYSKKLILEIMSNDVSEKFVSLEIDPYGYTNSKREKQNSKKKEIN